jgi:hypothetical protein
MSSRIKLAPTSYDGTLGDLYEGWAKHVLLAPDVVGEFHRQFCSYLNSADPLFLVRQVSGQERGQTLRTGTGARLRPTDNAPAWWIHYELFSGRFRHYDSFAAFVDSTPCHMFQIRLPENINSAGWYVAHMFNVKDRNVSFRSSDRNELMRRAARNIHPCNYFYVPKLDGRRHGEHPMVIAFFYDKFRSLYRTVWDDFLRLVEGAEPFVPVGASEYRYRFPINDTHKHNSLRQRGNPSATQYGSVVQYSHPRLCFKADMIEPLRMDDKFCVLTREGAFVMTKRQFYETFSNVTASVSYKQNRIYHYPRPPQRALRFKVE